MSRNSVLRIFLLHLVSLCSIKHSQSFGWTRQLRTRVGILSSKSWKLIWKSHTVSSGRQVSLSLSHTLLVLVSSTLIYAGIFSYFLYILHIFTFIHAVQCGVCAICAIDTICSSYSYLQLSATAERNKNRRRNTLWNVLNFCFGQKKEAKTLQQQLNNFLTHCCP